MTTAARPHDVWRGTWSPPPGTPVDLDADDPWLMKASDPYGHAYRLTVWVAALDDTVVAEGLQLAVLDGLCPTCSLDWQVRAELQRYVLPRVRDRVPVLRFRHDPACPACPTREGP